jgi:ribosomal protein S18 acetylase RimI-like enzyme
LSISDCVLELERITADHVLTEFDCGNPELNEWLTQYALRNDRQDSSRVVLLLEAGVVMGYYALTMGSVSRADVPPSLVRGMPGYPVGAVVLARFAIDVRCQGQGYGAYLLAMAIAMAANAAESAAARLFVVDAIDDDAAGFYRKFDFRELPMHPLRFYARLKDVAASMEAAL